MANFPRAGARIVHQSEYVTEYDDGTEEVRFSDTEWEIMSKDPAFGLILACGHPATASWPDGTCGICEAAMNAIGPEDSLPTSGLPLAAVLPLKAESTPDNDEIPF